MTALYGHPVTIRTDWQIRPLVHTVRNPVTAGLYQVSGQALTDDCEPSDWTVALKVLRRPDDAPAWLRADQPAQWNYWQRELLAYSSGLLATLSGDLAVPRCLGAHRPGERIAWLWIEYVTGTPAAAWPPDRYPAAARHLGLAQGPYLIGRPLPDVGWLAHDWLAAWTPTLAPTTLASLDDPDAWAHPLIRDVLSPDIAEATRCLAQDRDRLLAASARLPTVTVCHHDFWPPNLLSRTDPDGHERTVALDWSWVGLGAAGLDPANYWQRELLAYWSSPGFVDTPARRHRLGLPSRRPGGRTRPRRPGRLPRRSCRGRLARPIHTNPGRPRRHRRAAVRPRRSRPARPRPQPRPSWRAGAAPRSPYRRDHRQPRRRGPPRHPTRRPRPHPAHRTAKILVQNNVSW
ncbi:MAG: phosphotransferase family protein [Egibacteraceae bacterium]